jgi:hypothetical protein
MIIETCIQPLPPQTQLIMQAIPDIDNSTIAIVIGINGDGQVNINWGMVTLHRTLGK